MPMFGDPTIIRMRKAAASSGARREGLIVLNQDLSAFRDHFWCEGVRWENEDCVLDDIEPLDEVLIAVEPISSDSYRDFTSAVNSL